MIQFHSDETSRPRDFVAPSVAACATSCIKARFAHFKEIMGGRLVASLYDVTNYAKPMARDEQYLSRTKQINKHKRQDFLGNNHSTTKRSLKKHDGAGRWTGS